MLLWHNKGKTQHLYLLCRDFAIYSSWTLMQIWQGIFSCQWKLAFTILFCSGQYMPSSISHLMRHSNIPCSPVPEQRASTKLQKHNGYVHTLSQPHNWDCTQESDQLSAYTIHPQVGQVRAPSWEVHRGGSPGRISTRFPLPLQTQPKSP